MENNRIFIINNMEISMVCFDNEMVLHMRRIPYRNGAPYEKNALDKRCPI
jgi:hypothetical protein